MLLDIYSFVETEASDDFFGNCGRNSSHGILPDKSFNESTSLLDILQFLEILELSIFQCPLLVSDNDEERPCLPFACSKLDGAAAREGSVEMLNSEEVMSPTGEHDFSKFGVMELCKDVEVALGFVSLLHTVVAVVAEGGEVDSSSC